MIRYQIIDIGVAPPTVQICRANIINVAYTGNLISTMAWRISVRDMTIKTVYTFYFVCTCLVILFVR